MSLMGRNSCRPRERIVDADQLTADSPNGAHLVQYSSVQPLLCQPNPAILILTCLNSQSFTVRRTKLAWRNAVSDMMLAVESVYLNSSEAQAWNLETAINASPSERWGRRRTLDVAEEKWGCRLASGRFRLRALKPISTNSLTADGRQHPPAERLACHHKTLRSKECREC